MLTRRLAALALGAMLVAGLAACTTAQPDPTPTAPFNSEEEAFAAAEATYRAYVDALNGKRAGEKVDPTEFLIGDALEGELDTMDQLAAAGLRVMGDTDVAAVVGDAYDADAGSVEASVCLDSTETTIVDPDGNDVTPPDREARSLLDVTFVSAEGGLAIGSSVLQAQTC